LVHDELLDKVDPAVVAILSTFWFVLFNFLKTKENVGFAESHQLRRTGWYGVMASNQFISCIQMREEKENQQENKSTKLEMRPSHTNKSE
jgi:hypothetical protein